MKKFALAALILAGASSASNAQSLPPTSTGFSFGIGAFIPALVIVGTVVAIASSSSTSGTP